MKNFFKRLKRFLFGTTVVVDGCSISLGAGSKVGNITINGKKVTVDKDGNVFIHGNE